MMDQRPDPDALLAQVRADENHRRRGRLKIFFGYAAGVGKTYSMLENAHRAKGKDRDVVLVYVEPQARPATQALIEGFEAIPVGLEEKIFEKFRRANLTPDFGKEKWTGAGDLSRDCHDFRWIDYCFQSGRRRSRICLATSYAKDSTERSCRTVNL